MVILILLGLALRMFQLEQWASFGYDQEVAAFWIRDLLVNHKFSLIGQEISVGGVYIAPFFYYLMAPFYALTGLYPLGGNIFASIVAVLSMVMIYRLARRIFGETAAIITIFLYAIHPGIINIDRTVAPSNMIILLSVSTAYILTKTRKNWRDLLVLGIILGLSFSVHPTAVLLIPVTVAYFWFKKEKFSKSSWLLITVPVVLLVSPLILFDLRHDGLISRNIIEALSAPGDGMSISGLTSKIFSMVELVLVYWAGNLVSNDNVFIKMPLFALAVWVFLKSRELVLRLWVIVPWVALVLYPRHVPEYYFLLMTPIVLTYTVGLLFKHSLTRMFLAAIVFVSLVFSFQTLRSTNNQLGLYYKNQAVRYIINQAGGQPFTVYYSNEPGEAFGFNYLFWWHKAVPVENAAKKFLLIVPISSRIYRPSVDFGRIKVYPLPKEQE